MTKEEILNNQALDEHILFFSPLGKRPVRVPSEGGMPGIKYEKDRKGVQILDYGKAQFNFRAPDAKTVTIKGWGGSLPQEFELKKEEDSDFFSCVADGILPGFHYCDFFVDGVRTVNDLAPIGYGDFRIANYFEMPSEDSEFWMLQDVPHGDVNFEEIIRELNAGGYQGPLSVEWEDSGMERVYGGTEACEFVKKVDFAPSDIAFDSAIKSE